ncbi:DMT family transporter [Paracoccaceae bacterium Fryx2]|nr:DMT family transporter [Paracoccaceae bacterium Fryx2]
MIQQRTIPPRAWAELLLLAFIWGGSFLMNRLALDGVGVFTTVAVRVAGACMILWAVVLWRGLALPRGAGVWAAFLLMGVLNNAIPFTLITWGQLTIPSGLAAILNASTALIGVLVAAIAFRDEALTGRKLAGVGFGFAGVVVVIGWGALARLDLTSLAQLALIGASLSYALAGVWARKRLGGLAPQVAAAGMLTGSSLIMLPTALWLEGWPALDHGAAVWGALGYLAVVATAFAYLLYYRVLGMAGAGNLSLVTLLVAPVAIALGALVLGEALPLRAYVGFALIACGLAVIDGRILRLFRRRAWRKDSA